MCISLFRCVLTRPFVEVWQCITKNDGTYAPEYEIPSTSHINALDFDRHNHLLILQLRHNHAIRNTNGPQSGSMQHEPPHIAHQRSWSVVMRHTPGPTHTLALRTGHSTSHSTSSIRTVTTSSLTLSIALQPPPLTIRLPCQIRRGSRHEETRASPTNTPRRTVTTSLPTPASYRRLRTIAIRRQSGPRPLTRFQTLRIVVFAPAARHGRVDAVERGRG